MVQVWFWGTCVNLEVKRGDFVEAERCMETALKIAKKLYMPFHLYVALDNIMTSVLEVLTNECLTREHKRNTERAKKWLSYGKETLKIFYRFSWCYKFAHSKYLLYSAEMNWIFGNKAKAAADLIKGKKEAKLLQAHIHVAKIAVCEVEFGLRKLDVAELIEYKELFVEAWAGRYTTKVERLLKSKRVNFSWLKPLSEDKKCISGWLVAFLVCIFVLSCLYILPLVFIYHQ
eukprot:TRINITY_DN10042_c0_g1_i1.p1 TRINITY_DN10042_c0_g1~~TRINITY_DN10042_c0_g1_i1.p1  ORF type:complete len:248 (+),score=35.65 TRINITY_DN10042_c0_g1_i1:53-745(+)